MSNYDYTRCMMMKLLLSVPDNKGGSIVYADFDRALEIIKQVDHLTQGITKIIYLVGWQYNGHDDRYPEMFEVNERLKGACDKSGEEGLRRLFEQAAQYHTVIGLHVNFSDAYPQSGLWEEYLEHDLILKNAFGKLKVTGVWNGRKSYQVRLAEEWNSGYFKKRADALMALAPVKEAGTLHIDAFFVRKGKNARVADEKRARRRMIEYFRHNNVDVTSEFIYRERNCGMRVHFGASDTIGLIDAYWNPVLSRRDLLRYDVHDTAGGIQCNALTPDKKAHLLFYGNMHGEEYFKHKDWQDDFVREFITYTMPYYYLNGFRRLKVHGIGRFASLEHEGGVTSYIRGARIVSNGRTLKCGNDVCLPAHWKEGLYYAYSGQDGEKTWYVDGDGEYSVSRIRQGVILPDRQVKASGGKITMYASEGAYIIRKA